MHACACLVVLSFPSLEVCLREVACHRRAGVLPKLAWPSPQVVHLQTRMVELKLPYISGFLAFRCVSFPFPFPRRAM